MSRAARLGRTPIVTFKVPDVDPEEAVIRKAAEVAHHEVRSLLTTLSSAGLEAHPLLEEEIRRTYVLVAGYDKLFPAFVVKRALYSLDPDYPPVVVAAVLGWAERKGRIVSGWIDSVLLLQRDDGAYIPLAPNDLLVMYTQVSPRAVIVESNLLRGEWELFIMRLMTAGWSILILGNEDVPTMLKLWARILDPIELDTSALSREYRVILAYVSSNRLQDAEGVRVIRLRS